MTDLFLQQVPLDSRMSTSTITTRGEINFDMLCHGATPYYSFNLADLMTPDVRTADHIEKKITAKLEDTVTALQIGSGRTIAKFYIGKTYVPRRIRVQKFDPLNNNTWRKNGISSCWGEHKKKDYGRDGMVVLCAITKDTVPFGAMHQEDFTLNMEQRLIRHYREDPRLVHITENPGHVQRASRYPAYAIYIAFAYAEEDEETEEEEEEDEDTEVDN